ncbi:lipopolysaccharide biosynthesis protein [Enterococcus gallinarum]|uniref:lipopolysaccharide biosynthesis protein n=1 Tax=Enterococcus gallinarum TaxID=1353 RepID=UPI0022E45873|nr:hypothetical protein [Enterococcus gallinarum]
MISNSKKIFFDFGLNIFAMIISTVLSQLIVYPLISQNYGSSNFGNILTLIAIVNITSVVIGGSLNNIRLIDSGNQRRQHYNSFFLCVTTTGIITDVMLVKAFGFRMSVLEFTMYSALILLTSFRSYATVFFRLDLNYSKIFIHSVITSIGYLLGIVIFKQSSWIGIFLIGELLSLTYLLFNTKVVDEGLTFSMKKQSIINYFQLLSSNLVSNGLLYFDRLFLQLLLGGTEVSIFYAASLFGKLAGTALQPISGVLLSYLSVEIEINPWKRFKQLSIMIFSMSSLIFISSYFLAPIMIKVLYPEISKESLRYVMTANLSSILLVSSNLLQPILLKYIKIYWQNITQISYAIIYILLSYYFSIDSGLSGFIFASILANSFRMIFFVCLCIFYLRPKERKN